MTDEEADRIKVGKIAGERAQGPRPSPTESAEGLSAPEIPLGPAPDAHLVSLFDRTSFAAEQYTILRHLVERNHQARDLRVVAITGAAPGDGKTLTAVNLAGALAQDRRNRVLLVDADLRRPAVAQRLGLEDAEEPGLVQVQAGLVSLPGPVRYIRAINLFVLLGGSGADAPYDVLSSPFLATFFEAALREFRYIIVDTPPAVGFPDYQLLERLADGTFLVVGAHSTPRDMVERALEIVDPRKALGIVFNRADVGQISRYYEQYYSRKRSSP